MTISATNADLQKANAAACVPKRATVTAIAPSLAQSDDAGAVRVRSTPAVPDGSERR